MLEGLENTYLQGQDNYPCTMADANWYLTNLQGRFMQHCMPTSSIQEGIAFPVVGDGEEDSPMQETVEIS